MKKLLFIDHSLLNLPLIRIFKFLIRSALLGPAFFFLLASKGYSEIQIAVLDTGFCPDLISNKKSNIKIAAAMDFTQSVKLECHALNFDKSGRRFHGHLLIEEFLKFYQRDDQAIRIIPGIIFDQKGNQKAQYWKSAIDWVKSNNVDFVLTASGLLLSKNISLPEHLPGVWFVPSGRIIPGLKKPTRLYPQLLAPRVNLFIIGDYFDGASIMYDEALLYKKHIDYYFASGEGNFNGTSRAVGEALGRALSLCPANRMRQCLKEKSKKLPLFNSTKTILTF